MEENRKGSDAQDSTPEYAVDNDTRPVGPFLRLPPVTSSFISLGPSFLALVGDIQDPNYCSELREC